VVALDRAISDPRADAVLPDNVNGARTATQLLLDSGYRDIGILAGPLSTEIAAERLAGYAVAMRAAGLEPHTIEGGFRSEVAHEAVTRSPRVPLPVPAPRSWGPELRPRPGRARPDPGRRLRR